MTMIRRIAMTAVMMASAGVAFAGQQPRYVGAGFPMTPLQFTVLGSASVKEDPPGPTLTLDGMPASPHQIAVWATPRLTEQTARKSNAGSPSIVR